MKEREWLTGDDTKAMLEYLLASAEADRQCGVEPAAASDRKLRLFGAACCRLAWEHFPPDQRSLVGAAEAEPYVAPTYLPRSSCVRELDRLMSSVIHDANVPEMEVGMAVRRSSVAASCLHFDRNNRDGSVRWMMVSVGRLNVGPRAQADLLRDLFGNPFRPVSINPSWLTPTVLSLAHAAYDEHTLPSGELDPERLAVLSDALEEAGCDDAGILNHLRGPGPHVRGCWVVDLLLGRA